METVIVAEKPKKIHRFQIGLNVVVQIGLLIFLALMVNYLGFEHYRRWDFSRDQKYTLSDKTKRMLDSLKGKLRITVFFSPNTPITNDVQGLLTEYQYAAKGKIDVEQIESRTKACWCLITRGGTKRSRPRKWRKLIKAGWRWAKVRV